MNTIQLIDRKGKVRIGKKVVVSTIFDCNINKVCILFRSKFMQDSMNQ